MKVTQYLGFLGTSEKDGSIIKVTDYTKSPFPTFFFISKHGNFLFWKRGEMDPERKERSLSMKFHFFAVCLHQERKAVPQLFQ